jgi:hypothetical protein
MEQLKRAYWFTFWIKDNGPSKGESITFSNNISLRRAYSLFCSNLRAYRIGGSGPDSRPAGIKDVYWTLNEVYYDPEGILHYLTPKETHERLSEIGVQPDFPPWIGHDIKTYSVRR